MSWSGRVLLLKEGRLGQSTLPGPNQGDWNSAPSLVAARKLECPLPSFACMQITCLWKQSLILNAAIEDYLLSD